MVLGFLGVCYNYSKFWIKVDIQILFFIDFISYTFVAMLWLGQWIYIFEWLNLYLDLKNRYIFHISPLFCSQKNNLLCYFNIINYNSIINHNKWSLCLNFFSLSMLYNIVTKELTLHVSISSLVYSNNCSHILAHFGGQFYIHFNFPLSFGEDIFRYKNINFCQLTVTRIFNLCTNSGYHFPPCVACIRSVFNLSLNLYLCYHTLAAAKVWIL